MPIASTPMVCNRWRPTLRRTRLPPKGLVALSVPPPRGCWPRPRSAHADSVRRRATDEDDDQTVSGHRRPSAVPRAGLGNDVLFSDPSSSGIACSDTLLRLVRHQVQSAQQRRQARQRSCAFQIESTAGNRPSRQVPYRVLPAPISMHESVRYERWLTAWSGTSAHGQRSNSRPPRFPGRIDFLTTQ